MDADTPEIVEAVARAACEWDWIGTPGFRWVNTREPERGNWLTMATAAIAAARPFILEEAAKAMENLAFFTPVEELVGMTKQEMSVRTCHEGAAAIRSLSKDGEGLDDHQG